MRCLIARGIVAEDARPEVYQLDILDLGLSTWTWEDARKRRGLTVVRKAGEFNTPRIIAEWQMYAIEIEITPSYFNRLLLKRK